MIYFPYNIPDTHNVYCSEVHMAVEVFGEYIDDIGPEHRYGVDSVPSLIQGG